MKTIKLSKSLLRQHPVDILIKLGAVSEDGKRVHPEKLFFNNKDYQIMRKNLYQYARKEYKFTDKKRITVMIEMELLNYGPNLTLATAIKPGYALLDNDN